MTACLVEIATPWHASVISFQLAVSIIMSRSKYQGGGCWQRREGDANVRDILHTRTRTGVKILIQWPGHLLAIPYDLFFRFVTVGPRGASGLCIGRW